jgi:hypothetical protein
MKLKRLLPMQKKMRSLLNSVVLISIALSSTQSATYGQDRIRDSVTYLMDLEKDINRYLIEMGTGKAKNIEADIWFVNGLISGYRPVYIYKNFDNKKFKRFYQGCIDVSFNILRNDTIQIRYDSDSPEESSKTRFNLYIPKDFKYPSIFHSEHTIRFIGGNEFCFMTDTSALFIDYLQTMVTILEPKSVHQDLFLISSNDNVWHFKCLKSKQDYYIYRRVGNNFLNSYFGMQ